MTSNPFDQFDQLEQAQALAGSVQSLVAELPQAAPSDPDVVGLGG